MIERCSLSRWLNWVNAVLPTAMIAAFVSDISNGVGCRRCSAVHKHSLEYDSILRNVVKRDLVNSLKAQLQPVSHTPYESPVLSSSMLSHRDADGVVSHRLYCGSEFYCCSITRPGWPSPGEPTRRRPALLRSRLGVLSKQPAFRGIAVLGKGPGAVSCSGRSPKRSVHLG
jgi:hypothetical protein